MRHFIATLILIAATSPLYAQAKVSEHLTLGNPSCATCDPAKCDNFLIVKNDYALSYHQTQGIANWVSWRLSREWLGHTQRSNSFRADESLPAQWLRVHPRDYDGSGFDMGHLCPSEDRTHSVKENRSTFLMTNIMPQAPRVNRGPWKMLEAYCQRLARAGNELYIVAGSYGQGGVGANGGADVLARSVLVPSWCWKVVVVLPDKSGDDVQRIDANTEVIAVCMPNVEPCLPDWRDYVVTVADIEKRTGLDLLSEVPKPIRKCIETRTWSAK